VAHVDREPLRARAGAGHTGQRRESGRPGQHRESGRAGQHRESGRAGQPASSGAARRVVFASSCDSAARTSGLRAGLREIGEAERRKSVQCGVDDRAFDDCRSGAPVPGVSGGRARHSREPRAAGQPENRAARRRARPARRPRRRAARFRSAPAPRRAVQVGPGAAPRGSGRPRRRTARLTSAAAAPAARLRRSTRSPASGHRRRPGSRR